MYSQQIKPLIQSVPEIAAWPEMAAIFDRLDRAKSPDWEIPILVCEAVGGCPEEALAGAAAMACLQGGILFVDDMLDNDPRGEYHRLGYGAAANYALAIQAAAFRVIAAAKLNDERRTAVAHVLARVSIQTAYGQHLDVQNLSSEENYWQVVQAKSTPFYGACYEIGALLGGAGVKTAAALYKFGTTIGEIIQLEDDLLDALEKPANADWVEGRNNLLILYARTADHPQRDRFEVLLPQIQNPDLLEEAQQILISCGAVSYCLFHLVQRYQTARQVLQRLNLVNESPVLNMLDSYADSLVNMLNLSGIEVHKDLLLALSLTA